MAAIIHQTDKRSGITYAYESISYWDKEKKQSRAKRRLIGRVTKDGKIVPTDGRGRKRKNKEEAQSSKPSIDKPETTRSFYGATYLLDSIGEKLGLTKDLKYCFGDRYKQILSVKFHHVIPF